MSSRQIAPNVDALPVLAGVNASEFLPGRAIASPKIKAALRLIAGFANSPMAGLVDLTSVDVSGTEVLQVTTVQGSRITFALDRLEEIVKITPVGFEGLPGFLQAGL